MPTFSEYLDPESDLAHYGVKGMKWGVRKEYKKALGRNSDELWSRRSKLKSKERALYESARSSGKSRRESKKFAAKKMDKDWRKLDDWSDKSANAISERKNKTMAKIDAKRREAVKGGRQYAVDTAKANKLVTAVTAFVVGPGSTYGYLAAKGSGASTGQAVLAGALAGPLGGVAYRSLSRDKTAPYKRGK